MRGQGSNADATSENSAELQLPTQAAVAAAVGGEAARVVFASAPFWFHASSWHCRHPDSTNEHSYLDTLGPNTAEEVSLLYKNRQMKGSNLIVGLASDALPCKQVPAAFFRTLGYLFELAKSGIPYPPVTKADLLRGSPDPGWCTPLWQAQAPAPAPPTAEPPPGADLLAAAAERLLLSSPFWCYLYNHEPARSKKTPPKTAEEMLAVLRSSCLPDWAPLIGLNKDVATFNSLPPCLFMTMGSLTSLVASGATYTPVSLAQLGRYDKFFTSRTMAGNTQGMQQLALAPGALLQSQPSPLPSGPGGAFRPGAGAAPPQQYGDGPMYLQPQQQGASALYMQCGPSSQFMSPSPMMWYGANGTYSNYHIPPGQMYPFLPLASMAPPDGASVAVERSSAPEPGRRGGAPERAAAISTQLSSPLPDECGGRVPEQGKASRRGRVSLDASRPSGGGGGSGGAHGPREASWQTALFCLFLADSTDSRPEARWWLLAPGPAACSASIHGPFSSEEMILQYASGRLRDNQYICGATADVPGSLIPPSAFEPVAKLLQMVDGKPGRYVLHSPDDLAPSHPLLDEQSQLYVAKQQQQQRGRAGAPFRRAYKSHDGEGHKPRTWNSHSHPQ